MAILGPTGEGEGEFLAHWSWSIVRGSAIRTLLNGKIGPLKIDVGSVCPLVMASGFSYFKRVGFRWLWQTLLLYQLPIVLCKFAVVQQGNRVSVLFMIFPSQPPKGYSFKDSESISRKSFSLHEGCWKGDIETTTLPKTTIFSDNRPLLEREIPIGNHRF